MIIPSNPMTVAWRGNVMALHLLAGYGSVAAVLVISMGGLSSS
jgi:hypothetical protein